MDLNVLASVVLVAKETNKFGQKEANTFQNNVIYKKFQTILWSITRKSFILTTSLFFSCSYIFKQCGETKIEVNNFYFLYHIRINPRFWNLIVLLFYYFLFHELVISKYLLFA